MRSAASGIRFERELAESSSVDGIVLVKIPVGYSPTRQFAGGGFVDFLGVADGIPLAVEAKSCRTARFPLRRISQKQMRFLRLWSQCGGCSLILLRYGVRDVRLFVIPLSVLDHWLASGVKSIGLDELRKLPSIPRSEGVWRLDHLITLIRRVTGEPSRVES